MPVGFRVRKRLVGFPRFPFVGQEVVDRIIHVLIVGRTVSFKDPVLSYGNGSGRIDRTLFRLDEPEPETPEQIRGGSHGESGYEARKRPSRKPEGLQSKRHVLRNKRLLNVKSRQDSYFKVKQRKLDFTLEPATLHPLLNARGFPGKIVDNREPVAVSTVKGEKIQVLLGYVRDWDKKRGAGLVGIPLVKLKEPRHLVGHVCPSVLKLVKAFPVKFQDPRDFLLAGELEKQVDLMLLGKHVLHIHMVETLVVCEKKLSPVIVARRRPGSSRPLAQKIYPVLGRQVGQAKPGESRSGPHQKRFLLLGKGYGIVFRLEFKGAVLKLHSKTEPP